MSDLLSYKCPCCGGKIEFNSDVQKMKCPYCDTEFDVETLAHYDDILNNERPDENGFSDDTAESESGTAWEEKDGMSVYICHSCGGEVVGETTTAATFCPFCGNPVIVTGTLSGDLRPDYVIPFKFNKEEAVKAFKKHLEGKTLLPKIFKTDNHIEEIKGIYVPFWLFDATADARIRYRATKVRVYSSGDYTYTRTSYYMVAREGSLAFEKVPVDGSLKMDDSLMQSLEPFPFEDAVSFEAAYLSGYFADRYDATSDASQESAYRRMRNTTESEFRDSVVGYTSVIPEHTSVILKEKKVKYALYPVWLLHTRWKDKEFTFAMNGQTGKFVGNLPCSWLAFFLWFLGVVVGAGGIAYLLIYLLSSGGII